MAERDEEYYIDGTMMVIRVEHKLFRVPQHILMNSSSVFRDMFSPIAEGSKPDGYSDEQPLVLEGIQASGFARLLKCIYPLTRRETSFKFEFSLEEWKEALKVATAYEMTEVKAFIVGEMTPLLEGQPTLRIQLSQLYNVESLLVSGLHELVQRESSLSERDIQDIGIPYAVRIMLLRESGYNTFVHRKLQQQFKRLDINGPIVSDCLGL
ncbi:hypothetical protein APHAL10511_005124 [Amanita phalloides]|nr:hypothetical protein APHAL10511_005124 [Amanita phalloides]